jgi:hypothetical protein
MKPLSIVLMILGSGAFFATGAGLGVWFTRHYQILPVRQTAQVPAFQQVTPTPAPTLPAAVPAAVPAKPKAVASGPLTRQFRPNEQLLYQLTAEVNGKGIEMGQGAAIGLTMASQLKLLTESVDALGNGTMRVSFESFQMTGNFMGDPVELVQADGQTAFRMAGKTKVDTAQGQSIQGIPQLEFLRQPIHVTVAPNGEVVNVAGGFGVGQILSPIMASSPVGHTATDTPNGSQWQSNFNLPVPGMGDAVHATTQNTIVGYQNVRGRNCAVIQQVITSAKQDGTAGTLVSPQSAMGEGMQFSMPTFNLSGQNVLYADVDTGTLVQADINFDLKLDIGEQLKPIAELFQQYAGQLSQIAGGQGKAGQADSGGQQGSTLDMGLSIRAGLTLVE